jgi:O-antigen ligase
MTSRKILSNLVVWGAVVISLLITPFSYDPLNVSKFTVLTIVGFSIYSLILTNQEMLKDNRYKLILFASLTFSILGLISILATQLNLLQQIFGATGRNTGFLTYIALNGIFLGAVLISDKKLIERITKFLLISGIISLTYGLIQVFNLDPLNWTNSFSPVIGFLGNPNFQSSFMAITATSVFSMILNNSAKLKWRITLTIYIVLALFSIYKSNSQQGFLVFGAGILVVSIFWIKSNFQSKTLINTFLLFTTGVVFVTALDILQKAPWTSVFYKESVSNRGDLWRAGWRMTLDHPVFGVGFDNYGDLYRRYRDTTAISARGEDTISNTAHNVFLDISTSGGFPLLFAYLVIIGITLRAAIKLFMRTKTFDAPLVGIVGAWFAYMAQTFISINQIGLAVWGWVLSGSVIGYEIYTRDNVQISNQKTTGNLGTVLIGGFTGLIIGLPPFISDLVYRNALDSREIIRVESAAYQWPQNGDRMIQIANSFRDNDLFDQATKVARDATIFAPERYEAWQALASLPNLPAAEKAQAYAKLKELDPYNPILK